MLRLTFDLPDVIAVATHSMLAPPNTLRATSVQRQNQEAVHAALWWVRDRSGTYLTGNSTHPDAPHDAYAHGYGPGEDDASRILGRDDRVIDAIALHDPVTEECWHSQLIQAQHSGHTILTLTLDGNALELDTHRARRPAPTPPPT
ncbi:hypothetical protein OG458_42305 (plasmid) [Streptomyces sp. NBC_01281]|uniref:hypothetical protein n=1 Tax=Streptomyces sp. NBC_01281 TaxID=2903811 RepID=UPI002E1372F3|nr:hypothetical protein OG458_41500 [Streptomyces sp. NBC_01281]WSK66590.1 hypothetical protein OG458_42305 [Streptomyces sp. NBC_01281]